MHQLHYRFAAHGHSPNIRKVFQLLDDMPREQRHVLLEGLYNDFDVFSDLPSEQEQQQARYTEWKAQVRDLVYSIPGGGLIEHGLIAYILGKANGRITWTLAGLIDGQRDFARTFAAEATEAAEGATEAAEGAAEATEAAAKAAEATEAAAEALAALHEEHAALRNAYDTFCEMVVRPLVERDEPIDFGTEWLIDASEPVAPEIVRQRLVECAGKSDTTGRATHKASGPPEPWELEVGAFLDQVAAHFDVSIRPDRTQLDVRVANTAVCVSVHPYSAPSEDDPTEPLTLRIWLRGLSPIKNNFRKLGLPLNPKYCFARRLEFTVRPQELASLSDWVAEWIRGQKAKSPIPPAMPIALDYDEAYANNEGWLSDDFLWSKAAREAHSAWRKMKGQEEEGRKE